MSLQTADGRPQSPGVKPYRLPAADRRPDEAAAKRTLRRQIAKLETELAALHPEPPDYGRARGPRLVTIAELEEIRDGLADRLAAARRVEDLRGLRHELSRRMREELLLAPERHTFVRVSNEDVGEPGCCDWHVRPRLGILGMLMNWWRVVISSGCP